MGYLYEYLKSLWENDETSNFFYFILLVLTTVCTCNGLSLMFEFQSVVTSTCVQNHTFILHILIWKTYDCHNVCLPLNRIFKFDATDWTDERLRCIINFSILFQQ